MIKLFKLDELEDGTVRLQSQLSVGRDTADFILKNGELRVWQYNSSDGLGFGFHPTDIPYEIVANKKDMAIQML